MILLDTNVVSEMIRPTPEPAVEAWLATQPEASVFICATTEAELRYGVALLPAGRRRSVLADDIERMLSVVFSGRILAFDSPAAVARSRGAALATRNVVDFQRCGIDIVDPWRAPRTSIEA